MNKIKEMLAKLKQKVLNFVEKVKNLFTSTLDRKKLNEDQKDILDFAPCKATDSCNYEFKVEVVESKPRKPKNKSKKKAKKSKKRK